MRRPSPQQWTALEALVGLGLIVAGVAMVHAPAAVIVAGVGLFGMAVLGSRRGGG